MIISLAASLLAFAVAPQTSALPDGPLTLFAGNDHAVNFIVQDSVARSGGIVRAQLFRVYMQPIPLNGGAGVQEVDQVELACSGRRIRTVSISVFSEDGRLLYSPPGEGWTAIEARSTHDFTARVLCDDAQLPSNATVQGHAAARAGAALAVAAQ